MLKTELTKRFTKLRAKKKKKKSKIKYALDPVESKSVKVSLLNDDFQKKLEAF